MGDEWFSRNNGKPARVVGIAASHIILRVMKSVIRVRRDRMDATYRFGSRGKLNIGEAVPTVNTGANLYDVREGQVWRSNDKRNPRDVEILEVLIDDGQAVTKALDGTKSVRLRLERFCPGSTGYTLILEKVAA